jgi:hypothetical protein
MLRGELDSCLFFGVPLMTQDEDNYRHKNICNISRISNGKAQLYMFEEYSLNVRFGMNLGNVECGFR